MSNLQFIPIADLARATNEDVKAVSSMIRRGVVRPELVELIAGRHVIRPEYFAAAKHDVMTRNRRRGPRPKSNEPQDASQRTNRD